MGMRDSGKLRWREGRKGGKKADNVREGDGSNAKKRKNNITTTNCTELKTEHCCVFFPQTDVIYTHELSRELTVQEVSKVISPGDR